MSMISIQTAPIMPQMRMKMMEKIKPSFHHSGWVIYLDSNKIGAGPAAYGVRVENKLEAKANKNKVNITGAPRAMATDVMAM